MSQTIEKLVYIFSILFKNRCTVRQVDILATTLEPVRHRDYTVAAKQYYPTTPLKKLHDEDKKCKKKKKKLTRKKSRKDNTSNARSLNLDGTLTGAVTPESIIDSSREEAVRKGHKELHEKLGKERHLSAIEQEQTGEVTPGTGRTGTVSEYADSLASRILQESIPKTVEVFDPKDLYAQDLASSIMQQALDTVELYMIQKEKSMYEKTAKARLPPEDTQQGENRNNENIEEKENRDKTDKNNEDKTEKEVPATILPHSSKPEKENTQTSITEKPVDITVLDKYRK